MMAMFLKIKLQGWNQIEAISNYRVGARLKLWSVKKKEKKRELHKMLAMKQKILHKN